MSTIPLHKERGLDPHLTFCPKCGGEGTGLTIGELRKAEVNTSGQYVYANRGKTTQTGIDLEKQNIINSRYDLHWEEVKEGEKVPDSEPCENCKAEIDEHSKIVSEGGVYFRCAKCKCTGVIKPNEFTEAIRKHSNIKTPNPCGVEFEKCEEHGGV